jgi:pantetheine-phosphate adenylyltransferase
MSSKGATAKSALFAGSFDPLTLGHLDIIRRAARIFDRLIIGVGISPGKNPYFTLEERTAMIQESSTEIINKEVISFEGLTVDCARRCGAQVLIRGVRSVQDYSFELQMAQMNQALEPQIETVIFPTLGAMSHISSSMARELATHHGDITLLVPPPVVRRFESKGWVLQRY